MVQVAGFHLIQMRGGKNLAQTRVAAPSRMREAVDIHMDLSAGSPNRVLMVTCPVVVAWKRRAVHLFYKMVSSYVPQAADMEAQVRRHLSIAPAGRQTTGALAKQSLACANNTQVGCDVHESVDGTSAWKLARNGVAVDEDFPPLQAELDRPGAPVVT